MLFSSVRLPFSTYFPYIDISTSSYTDIYCIHHCKCSVRYHWLFAMHKVDTYIGVVIDNTNTPSSMESKTRLQGRKCVRRFRLKKKKTHRLSIFVIDNIHCRVDGALFLFLFFFLVCRRSDVNDAQKNVAKKKTQ